MKRARTIWRGRAWLLGLLGVLVAANIGLLVSYQLFYDARLQALRETAKDLESKRDAARQAAEKVKATEVRLQSLQTGLEEFYRDSLGTRKERLASVIEDVYAITGKAGLRPDDIGFAEAEMPGAQRFQLSFLVTAKYPEVKKLLAAFESNPQFLILESVSLAADSSAGAAARGGAVSLPGDPDVLKVGLVVAHYFRSDSATVPRRRSGGGPSRRSTTAAAAPAKAASGKDLE